MSPNGPGAFFPTNPDLGDILGDTDFDFEIFIFLDVSGSQISRIPDTWISRFPDSWAGCCSGGHQLPDLGGFWTALPDHRIQEIQGTRQYRENPISASPVWRIEVTRLNKSFHQKM